MSLLFPCLNSVVPFHPFYLLFLSMSNSTSVVSFSLRYLLVLFLWFHSVLTIPPCSLPGNPVCPFSTSLFSLCASVLSLLPEGRPGMSDVLPPLPVWNLRAVILSFDSSLLSPLLFFCVVLLPFVSYLFLPAGPFF